MAPAERWVLGRVRKNGARRFIIEVTGFSMLTSISIVAVVMGLAYGLGDPSVPVALGMAAGVPAFVAPLATMFTVRLTDQIDRASRLLWEAAHTDPLTGVANRRAFFQTLEQGAAARQHVIDIAAVDVDDFKLINDEHGHVTGDRALQQVAAWLCELAGEEGLVARTGGDEFALVMPTDPTQERATREHFELDDRQFSISLGWARCEPEESIDAALRAADEALYGTKRAWRGLPQRERAALHRRGHSTAAGTPS